MTNEELQDAIVMTHAAIKGSSEFSPTKAHLELHMRELLRIQRQRAEAPSETLAQRLSREHMELMMRDGRKLF